jgi:hypothetical protein
MPFNAMVVDVRKFWKAFKSDKLLPLDISCRIFVVFDDSSLIFEQK